MPGSLSIEERVAYIQNLGNAEIALYSAGPIASANVVGGSTVAFLDGMDGGLRADVSNSTLLAQYAADIAYPGRLTGQRAAWNSEYIKALKNVGWVAHDIKYDTVRLQTGDCADTVPSDAEVSDISTYVTVDKLVIALAAGYLTGEEHGLFVKTIQSLQKDRDALKVFDSKSKYDDQAGFQLGVASQSGNSALLKMSMYKYSASQNISGSALFLIFGTQQITFYAAHQTMALDGTVYASVRETVKEKLGANIKQFIMSIKF
ncbi:hypothetical protein ONZ51_g9434 [Trametes cubensis]|uniref:Uncharacterized protein n=1 Tax=Trametes cubensis TaxID=1111947 RepID=A0AAD7TNX0_9APHY|nr:hypothetical protein ONZ51_g9434 [Trametes cubensis]